MVALAQLPWSIPEYHDEQRFSAGGTYGPMAYLFASPFIGTFNYLWQVAGQGPHGLLAAVLLVDTPTSTTLPPEYANLHLKPGMNCVWLANTTTDPASAAWRAYVNQANLAGICDRSVALGPALAVVRETQPGMGPGDYPAAARFGEAATSRQALIGFRCLDGWCMVGPAGFTPTPLPVAGTTREDKIRGWYDEQHLAIRKPGGTMRPGPLARIIPYPNLDSRSPAYYGVWRPAAKIVFIDSPADTKYADWGLKQGENILEMRYVATSQKWEFHIKGNGTTVPDRPWTHQLVMPHLDAGVPGTARFRWTLADEGIWIPCGDACCHADGM